jgi:hypothetical protein
MKKPAIDVDCRVAQSSIETHKKTESVIIVTTFKTLYCQGMFKNYSESLEEIASSGCWVGIRTGKQTGLWLLILTTRENQEIAKLNGCIIKDINLNYAKEEIVVGIKIQHTMSIYQPAIEATVSTAAKLQLIRDEEPFDINPEDM